jgi:hypothetical protein
MVSQAPPPAPPRPPLAVTLDDNDERQRFRFRLFQVTTTLVTVLVTGWFCSFGWVPAVLALCVAKHVLVAILAMGLGVDADRR